MDDLNSQFGQLSTNAPEWKPGSAAPDTETSDLRASAVKEFVPGAGWSTDQNTADETPKVQTPSVPAGPTPPPLPSFHGLHSMGLGDDLWRHYRDISLDQTRQMEPDDPLNKAIPPPYFNGYCLDAHAGGSSRSSSYGYPSTTFQVSSREDGKMYCLHRFDNVRSVSPKIAAAVTDRFKVAAAQEHPGIVPFYQCFMAQRAVFFVHHLVPGAQSLRDRLGGPLSEPVLWSVVCQIVSALLSLHGANLACRALGLHQVLSTTDSTVSTLRVRLGCLGIIDTLEFQARRHVDDLQLQDMRDLGLLLMSLATGTIVDSKTDRKTVQSCESFLTQNFSRDFQNLVLALCNARVPPGIQEVSQVVAPRAWAEQDSAYRAVDRFEHTLSLEYDSSRMFRLMLKLGFCNERPEFGPNRRWSQSGDCYVLNLFADFVFHQADGAGAPVMDLGHVVSCLNKLDAAAEENISLASRDGKTLMVASYADIARCLQNAFHELCSGSVPPAALQYE